MNPETKWTPSPRRDIPVAVQILSTLLYGGFAITAVALAFAHFWPAGILLAIILGWRGGFIPQKSPAVDMDELVEKLRHLAPNAEERSSGNASFDAYRSDVLVRLEQEQENFQGFLERLRDAKDRSEFDSFMDDRATRATKDIDAQPA
ncbi:MAG: DUF2852 domain-containing protein [Pseudomonadota bacterium]